MYCKLFSYNIEILRDNKKLIESILSGKTDSQNIALITKAYYKKQKNDPSFNSDYFFLDLYGYLKYLEFEAIYPPPKGFPQKVLFDKERQKIIETFFQKYGYDPQETRAYGIGSSKRAYLNKSTNQIIRFYYANSANFFLHKLIGTSEADVSEGLNSNILAITSLNIPGEPVDIVERALPLSQVIYSLRLRGEVDIIKKINNAVESNILITNFIEQAYPNVGLVVRQNNRGNKKVYVVALDLELRARFITGESEQAIFLRMQRFCKNSKPKVLNYDKLIEFIPQLEQLSCQKIKKN